MNRLVKTVHTNHKIVMSYYIRLRVNVTYFVALSYIFILGVGKF